jgi:hypothetical protein
MVCAIGRGVDATEIVDNLFSIVTGACPSDFRSAALSAIAAEDLSLAAAASASRRTPCASTAAGSLTPADFSALNIHLMNSATSGGRKVRRMGRTKACAEKLFPVYMIGFLEQPDDVGQGDAFRYQRGQRWVAVGDGCVHTHDRTSTVQQIRRIATQTTQGCCQEIRVATEVRPADAPDRAVGSVGNSLRASNPTVGGPMPSRTALPTSCNGEIAPATGIFKAGSV